METHAIANIGAINLKYVYYCEFTTQIFSFFK
jgi:hypothetical protein